MEDGIFFNQSKYIKEMLKKFRLEDSKPTKTPMSTEIKLTKDDEANSVGSSKYRENPKTTHLEAVKRIFRLRCKGVAKQIVDVVPKGLALRVVLGVSYSKDESGKGFKLDSLLSQLEIHGAGVSTKDANQKFLRLYCISSSTQNVAFVSENTSSTIEVSIAYGAYSSSGHNPQRKALLNTLMNSCGHNFYETKEVLQKIGRKLQFNVAKDRD
ncbi:hypothetical protein Tco_0378379 [Tanacetum coccineum]